VLLLAIDAITIMVAAIRPTGSGGRGHQNQANQS